MSTPWEVRRWTILASLVMTMFFSAVLWHVFSGCGGTSGDGGGTAGASSPLDRTLAMLEALKDDNLLRLSMMVAWFDAQHERLPRDIEEIRIGGMPKEWGPVPDATSDGRPITYVPGAGPREFGFILPGPDGKVDTDDDVVIPQEVPADVPQMFPPDVFQTWWRNAMISRLNEQVGQGLLP